MKLSVGLMLVCLLGGLLETTAQMLAPREPLVDLSSTSVEVDEADTSLTTSVFTVKVQRVDDLMSDEGDFLAERIMAVAFNFDVDNDNIIINDVPVPLGVSTIQVEAAVIVGPAVEVTEENFEDLMNSFDIGLVTVMVSATAEMIELEDGSQIRRITIEETVTEINGQTVVQTEIGQQIVDISDDGTTGNYLPDGQDFLPDDPLPVLPPPPVPTEDFPPSTEPAIPTDVDDSLEASPLPPFRCGGANHGHRHNRLLSFLHAFKKWWKDQPVWARVALSGVMGSTAFVLFFVAIPLGIRALVRKTQAPTYERVEQQEEEDVKVVYVDEKKPLMEQAV